MASKHHLCIASDSATPPSVAGLLTVHSVADVENSLKTTEWLSRDAGEQDAALAAALK